MRKKKRKRRLSGVIINADGSGCGTIQIGKRGAAWFSFKDLIGYKGESCVEFGLLSGNRVTFEMDEPMTAVRIRVTKQLSGWKRLWRLLKDIFWY